MAKPRETDEERRAGFVLFFLCGGHHGFIVPFPPSSPKEPTVLEGNSKK
jgi:hypothetical protein